MSETTLRIGEERAFRLFEDRLTSDNGRWIPRARAMRFRGIGRAMVRRVYRVARHIEGAKVSRSLGKRGVDTVSLASVRTALHRLTNGVLAKGSLRRASRTGRTLVRYISRTR